MVCMLSVSVSMCMCLFIGLLVYMFIYWSLDDVLPRHHDLVLFLEHSKRRDSKDTIVVIFILVHDKSNSVGRDYEIWIREAQVHDVVVCIVLCERIYVR